MKIISNNFHLEQLFKEARQEQPVMDIKEIEGIINTGHYQSSVKQERSHKWIGRMLIASALIITPLIGYLAIRTDKKEIASEQHAVVNVPVQSPVSPVHNVASQFEPVSQPEKPLKQKLVSSNSYMKKADFQTATKSNDKDRSSAGGLQANAITSVKVSETYHLHSSKAGAYNNNSNEESTVTFTYHTQNIKMKTAGNEIKELSIDGRPIPSEQFNEYSNLISEAKKYASGNMNGINDDEADNLKLVRFLSNELHKDNIVTDKASCAFELSSSQLMINQSVQSVELFQKYKKLYEEKGGKNLTGSSVYRFEKRAR